MHHEFKAVTLNHKHAPLAIRELVALDPQEITRLIRKITEFTPAQDILVLSTCNRTEIYYAAPKDLSHELIKLVGIEKGIADIEQLSNYFVRLNKSIDATRHLFRVSIGLEAQVLGDMQISNQVKRAYQASADENVAGPFLHRLMHTIFFTSKRVAQETSLRDGAASVSYAAADLALNLAAEIVNPKALVIGLGEIGADVCRNLRDSNSKHIAATDIYISNRTLEKAAALAAECGFQTIPFEEVAQYIEQADVVISALALPQPLITKDLLAKHELLRYKYFIDLSVPRSVEEGVENIPSALVYHIDDIKSKVDEALGKRLAAIPQVEAIIEEALTDLKSWAQEMEVSPTIKKLKNTLEQIRQEEMARHLKNLSTEETQRLEAVTKGMMQKIIKLPVLQLKAACKRGEAETLIDVLNDLFDLERQANEHQQ